MDIRDIAYFLGLLLIPALIVAGGYFWASRINKNREYEDQVKWPIVLCWIIGGSLLFFTCSPASRSAVPTNVATVHENAAEALNQ